MIVNLKNLIILIFSLIILFACTYTGVHDTKAGFSRYEILEFEVDYKTVYEIIDRKISQCFANKPDLSIDKKLYFAIKMGEFGVSDKDGFFLLIELIASEDINTKVGIFTTKSAWNKYRNRIEGWRDGSDTEC